MTVVASTYSSNVSESSIFTSKQIAERALRKIGAFSINDSEAEPAELKEALYWLDMIASELVGTNQSKWLIPATIEKELEIDTASVDLRQFFGDQYPSNGIAFAISAWLRDSSGLDQEIAMWNRTEYESISDKDVAGRPAGIYIDRREEEALYVNPVPNTADMTLRLVVQTFAPNMIANNGENKHKFLREWQRFIVLQLAADIGSGPVRKLNRGDIDDFRRDAAMSKALLDSYSNKDKTGQLRRTRAWGQ